jgi:hypothetical protein
MMNNPIKAIETRYKGYRFRSRLEARWAVFFDALGFNWVYEPEGLLLPNGAHYLPDFAVTSLQGRITFYEIKPRGVTSDPKVDAYQSARKAYFSSLERSGGCSTLELPDLILLSGDPVDWVELLGPDGGVCPRCGVLTDQFEYGVSRDRWLASIGCQPCDFETPGGSGNDEEPGVLAWTEPHKGSLHLSNTLLQSVEARVRRAALAARGARFEHEARQ